MIQRTGFKLVTIHGSNLHPTPNYHQPNPLCHTTRLRGAKQNPRGERHTKKANLLQRSRHPHTSALHYRTSPTHQAHRAPTYTSALSHVLTRAQRTRVHFCPQHWLLSIWVCISSSSSSLRLLNKLNVSPRDTQTSVCVM